MHYARILLLYSQNILAHRGRSIVGFLITLLHPLILLLFWQGAGKITSSITPNFIISYYLFLVIIGALLRIDIEEDVSTKDILEGHLSQYLLKPFSYYWLKFFEDTPYRFLQGFYGLCVWGVIISVLPHILTFVNDGISIFLAFVLLVFGYYLAFTFKMIVGLLTFWIKDTQAMYHVVDAIILVFAGYVVPLTLMPDALKHIATLLPFSYMAYFPVAAFQGTLGRGEIIQAVFIEIFWVIMLTLLYQWVWRKGLKKYSGYGQ